MIFNERDVSRLYDLLYHNKSYSRVRCHNVLTGNTISEELIYGKEEYLKWVQLYNGKGNCFIGRNPRNKDGTIARITALSFDFDPIYPKGTISTQNQTKQTILAAKSVFQNYPYGYIGLSGNGSLLLYTSNTFECIEYRMFEQQFSSFERNIRKLISNFQGVRLDATFDNARLIKIIGTISTKGEYRQTRFINLPNRRSQDSKSLFENIRDNYTVIQNNRPSVVESNGTFNFGSGKYPSRSEADFALVSYYKHAGLTAEVAHEGLHQNIIGRMEERGCKDHTRILSKIYGSSTTSWNISSNDRPIQVYSPTTGMQDYISELQNRSTHSIEPELSTGYKCIDNLTWGIKRGDIYTVGARTGTGKTNFLINVSSNLLRQKKRVLYLSTEMSYRGIWDRLFAVESGQSYRDFQTGAINTQDNSEFSRFRERFEQYQFNVCDYSQPNLEITEKLIEEYKPDVFIFDHIQHIGGDINSRYIELSKFTKSIKDLCRKYNCAALVASQLNRYADSIDSKTSKKVIPQLYHLKECGTIEEESSVVLLLWNNGNIDETNESIMCKLAKNRDGETGMFELGFSKKTIKFYEIK